MQDKGQRAKAAIVEAAQVLFYHQGYSATSYSDIAEQTGFGKGNIHYYFNSKDELLKAVVEQRVKGTRRLLEEWVVECQSPYDRLTRFIGMFVDNAEDLAKYGCPMGTLNDELGKNEPILQDEARQMFDLFLDWLVAQFRLLEPLDTAQEHAEQFMVFAQGISVLAHAYQSPDLVRRQSSVVFRWLAAICNDGPRQSEPALQAE